MSYERINYTAIIDKEGNVHSFELRKDSFYPTTTVVNAGITPIYALACFQNEDGGWEGDTRAKQLYDHWEMTKEKNYDPQDAQIAIQKAIQKIG